jgi:hypothetical protein
VTELGVTVRRLEQRLDALDAEVGGLRETWKPAARPSRVSIPATPVPDEGDDGVVDRASVPPLDLDAVGSRAFDVLLGAGAPR